MTGWYNSDSWMDIVDHLLLVLGVLSVAVATAAVPVWVANHKATKTERAKNAKTLEAIRHQVENDHPDDENMRDQIDRIERKIESQGVILQEIQDRQNDHGDDIRGMRTDMGGLRGELRDDRGELREFKTRVHDFVDREHPGAPPL